MWQYKVSSSASDAADRTRCRATHTQRRARAPTQLSKTMAETASNEIAYSMGYSAAVGLSGEGPIVRNSEMPHTMITTPDESITNLYQVFLNGVQTRPT